LPTAPTLAMYICICNAVTDREIRACARDGANSFAEVRDRLCVGANCGKCAREAKAIIREENARQTSQFTASAGLALA